MCTWRVYFLVPGLIRLAEANIWRDAACCQTKLMAMVWGVVEMAELMKLYFDINQRK